MFRKALFLALVFVSVFCDLASYLEERQQFLANEEAQFLGSSLELTPEEQVVNSYLKNLKYAELDYAFETADFAPAQNFLTAKDKYDQSPVFQFIRQMPKGAALHIHDTAITSLDFLVYDVTYRDNLYMCVVNFKISFQFAQSAPANTPDCTWTLTAEERQASGNAAAFDDAIYRNLTLVVTDPFTQYPNINAAWTSFSKYFVTSGGLINYEPVFRDYFYKGLEEFYLDNVQYMEIRTTLPTLYRLDGSTLTDLEEVQIYQETFQKFTSDHSDFVGAKIIYAPSRRVSSEKVGNYIDNAIKLKAAFPETVAGFDLVGQEDLGVPLADFLEPLLSGSSSPELKYFFHAGETTWQGMSTDLNVIDALLLNTTRIGHGYAIAKHPLAVELARNRNVPIEICPLSNQVLMLVADLRNHPAVPLMATNFPLVISSDDPAVWNASALSYDYYAAFLAMTSRETDLRFLKQIAYNSLSYSALEPIEKDAAVALWEQKWDSFIQTVFKSISLPQVLFENQ